MSQKSLYLRLLGYVRPYWRTFALSLLATMIFALTEPALPALIKPMLDGSFVNKDPQWIILTPLLLIGLAIVRGAAGFASKVAMNWVSSRVVMDLRQQLFEHLLRLPASFFDTQSSGKVLSKITFNVEQVTNAATEALIVLVRDSISLLGLLVLMVWMNWKLSLITLVLVPPIVVIVRVVSRRMRDISRNLQDTMGEMTHTLEEAIGGQHIVRLYGGQEQETRHFATSSNWVRRYFMKRTVAAELNVQVIQLLAVFALALMIYLGARQSAAGETTVGAFVSFFAAMAMILSPLKKLTNVNSNLQRGLAAAESLFALLDTAPEPDTGRQRLEQARGRLTFRHVDFRYPDAPRDVLRDIQLDIPPGEHIALVGASGSGKSTLVKLIPRFYPVERGHILLDGTPIDELELANLRHHIALVSQDIVLFDDSVRNNIAYGELGEASDRRIIDAAKAAHAWEFIEKLPDGLDTRVGERGAMLSGGQRQRLAIARALLKDAPILILDEATSALDTRSEQLIQDALEKLKQGRTTIVIAHRLSTVEGADRIIVMDDGRIVESGDHTTLLKQAGAYAALYRQQFRG